MFIWSYCIVKPIVSLQEENVGLLYDPASVLWITKQKHLVGELALLVSIDGRSDRQRTGEYCLSQNLLRRQAGDDLYVCLYSFISNISAR